MNWMSLIRFRQIFSPFPSLATFPCYSKMVQDIIFRFSLFISESRGTTFEKKFLHPPSYFQDGCHPFLPHSP